MLNLTKTTIGAAVAAMIAAGPLSTVPSANAEPTYANGMVQQVRDNGKPGNWNGNGRPGNWNHGGNWNHRPYYRGNNNNWVGPAIGLGTGLVIGSMLAQPRYAAPAYSNWDAYCSSKYRTYKPWTGTYTGYDGREHRCR